MSAAELVELIGLLQSLTLVALGGGAECDRLKHVAERLPNPQIILAWWRVWLMLAPANRVLEDSPESLRPAILDLARLRFRAALGEAIEPREFQTARDVLAKKSFDADLIAGQGRRGQRRFTAEPEDHEAFGIAWERDPTLAATRLLRLSPDKEAAAMRMLSALALCMERIEQHPQEAEFVAATSHDREGIRTQVLADWWEEQGDFRADLARRLLPPPPPPPTSSAASAPIPSSSPSSTSPPSTSPPSAGQADS